MSFLGVFVRLIGVTAVVFGGCVDVVTRCFGVMLRSIHVCLFSHCVHYLF